MKLIRRSVLCLIAFLLTASVLRAQDFSSYRGFSLGANLATVLKQTDQKLADVNVIHPAPALFQEVTWWPPSLPGTSYRSDSVEQILFSFYNGTLYKMSVIYDEPSTEGLTAGDMEKSISAKYGAPTTIASASDQAATDPYSGKETVVASWQDTQYSFNLVRSPFPHRFRPNIFPKRPNPEAELALVQTLKPKKQTHPQT